MCSWCGSLWLSKVKAHTGIYGGERPLCEFLWIIVSNMAYLTVHLSLIITDSYAFLLDITWSIYSYFQCGCYLITKSTFYNEGKFISVVTQRHRITYIWSTSTTQHSAHTINNIEIIMWSLCVAENSTICDWRQFLIKF